MNLMDLVATLRLEVAGFIDGVQKAQTGLKTLQGETMKFRDVLQNSTKEWEAFGVSMQTAGAKMAVVGGIFTGALTIPLKELAEASVDMGSRFQQAAIALETMTQSAARAQQFLEALKEFAATTPFQFPDLLETSQRMTALGFASEAVIPMLRTIGDAMSALGRGQEGITAVTQAFGKMLERGIVSAREMNMLATQGIASWKILAESLGVTIPELMKMVRNRAVEAVEAIPALLEGMNAIFHDQMKRQMDTFAGQWSNFKERLSYVFGNIGTVLLPFAKAFAEWGIAALGAIDNVVKAFGELPQPLQVAGIAFGVVVAGIGPLIAIVGTLVGVMGVAVEGLSAMAVALGYKTLGAAVTAASGALGGLLATLAPFGVAVAGVIAIWALWDVEPVRNSVLGLWEAMKGFWDETLKPMATDVAAMGVVFAQTASEMIGSGLSEFWNWLKDLAADLGTSFDGLMSASMELGKAWDALVYALEPLKEPLLEVWDLLIKLGEVIVAAAWYLLEGALKGILLAAQALVKDGLEELLVMITDFTEGIQTLVDWITKATKVFTEWDAKLRNMPNIWSMLGLEKVNELFVKTTPEVEKSTKAFDAAREAISKMGTDTRSAMQIAKDSLDAAQKSYNEVATAYQKKKVGDVELTAATENLAKAQENFKVQLDLAQPSIAAAIKGVKDADAAVISAEKAVKAASTALADGSGKASALAEANRNLATATENSKNAHAVLNQVAKETGITYSEFDRGLKVVRESLQTHTKTTDDAKESLKRLKEDVEAARKAYVSTWESFRQGKATYEDLIAAQENLQLTTEKLHPEKAAEAFIKARADEKKAVEDFLKWMEGTYLPKMQEMDRQQDAINLRSVELFSKAADAMKKSATEQIAVRKSLSDQLVDYNNYDTTKAIEAALNTAERVSDAYQYLEIKATASFDAQAEAATEAYNEIYENADATYNELLQAERAMLIASIAQWQAWGVNIPKEAKDRLGELENALDTSLNKQKGFLDKFFSELKRAADVFGRDLAKALWEAMFGDKRNDQLDKEAEELRASMAERVAEWEKYKTEVQVKIGEITAKHAENLAQELADLQASMDEKTQAWLAYQQESQEKLQAFKEKQSQLLIAEVEELLANLAERAAAWEKYKLDAQAGLDEFTAKQDAALEQQKADLLENLAERAEAWSQYQANALAGLAEFITEQDAKLAAQKADLLESLAQRAEAEAEYREEALADLEAFKQKQLEKLEDELSDLNRSLASKRASYLAYVDEVNEKLAELQESSAEKLAEDLDKLKKSFDGKTKAYAEYVANVNKKLQRIGEDLEEQIDDETRETQRGIDDRRTAFAREERDINEKINRELAKGASANQQQIADWRKTLQDKRADLELYIQRAQEDLEEFTDDHRRTAEQQTADLNEELARRTQAHADARREYEEEAAAVTREAQEQLTRQTEDLMESLGNRTAEWEAYRAEVAQKIVDAQNAYTRAVAAEEASVQESLGKRQREWEKYQADIAKKLADAQKAHDEAIAKEVKKVNDGLNEKRAAWEKYQADIAKKLEDAQKAHDDAIAKEVAKVAAGLSEKYAAWEKYQADIAKKIEAAQKKHDEAIEAETKKVAEDLAKRQAAYEKYLSDIREKMEKARADEAAALEKELAALAANLADKQKEHEKYIAGVDKRLKELAEEHVTFWEKVGAAGVKAAESIFGALISLGIKEFFDYLNDAGVFKGLKASLSEISESLTKSFEGAWDKIKGAFSTLADWIWSGIKKIAGGISDLFTSATSAASTATSAAGTVASGASGAAGAASGIGSAAASGAVAIVGAVAGVATAISSIVGNFQMRAMNQTLDLIEESTRYTAISMVMNGGVIDQMNKYFPKLEGVEKFNYDILAPILGEINDTLIGKLDVIHASLVVDIKNILIDLKDYTRDILLNSTAGEETTALIATKVTEAAASLAFLQETFGASTRTIGASESSRSTLFAVDVSDLNDALEGISDETEDVSDAIGDLQASMENVYAASEDSLEILQDSAGALENLDANILTTLETLDTVAARLDDLNQLFTQANVTSFYEQFLAIGDAAEGTYRTNISFLPLFRDIIDAVQSIPSHLQATFATLNIGGTIAEAFMSLENTMALYDTRGTLTAGFSGVTNALYSIQSVLSAGQSAQLTAIYSLGNALRPPTPPTQVTINVTGSSTASTQTTALANALRQMGVPV